MSTALIKVFWIALFISLSISFAFLGAVGVPMAQQQVVKNIQKSQWYQPDAKPV
jgi:hypothetical protein